MENLGRNGRESVKDSNEHVVNEGDDLLSSAKKLRSQSKNSKGKARDSSPSPSSSSSSGAGKEFQSNEASENLGHAIRHSPSQHSPPEHEQSEQTLRSPLDKSIERRNNLEAPLGPTPELVADEKKKLTNDRALVGLPMQSPPVQVMTQADNVDLYRIPSSVFARTKSQAPMEWSMASNESLFSIGNSSFSRDHVFLLEKSGELDMFTLNALQNMSTTQAMMGSNNTGILVLEPPRSANRGDASNAMHDREKPQKQVTITEEMQEGHGGDDEKAPASSSSPQSPSPRPSYGSSASTKSFTFPILTTEEKSGAVKEEQETPQQPASSEQTSWFSCACCCPRCC